jgi:arylsulfatase A-like enzyme
MPLLRSLLLLILAPIAAVAAQPNLIYIMADDLGWRDLGCFGSNYHQTPHLDQLAAKGTKFTRAYAANPLCSPTRSSVLTGLWPARTGITAPVCHLPNVLLDKQLSPGNPKQRVLTADSVTRLDTSYLTLPEILRTSGYRTAHFGKWHLGPEPYSPLQHGFDLDWPHSNGPGPAGSYVAPWRYPANLSVESKPGEHIEDRLADEVVRFIHENKTKPFFINYWQFSVHSPYDAKDELVAKYRRLIDPANPQRNPVYAAMVESLDDSIGKVMAAVEECGLAQNTVIVFYSDNGGVSWGGKGAEEHKSARFQADMKSPPTSNLPLRNGKASLYEGGVRVPCIVVWPGVTQPGSSNATVIQSIDWMPTLLEIAGIPLPPEIKPDGRSLVPILMGGKLHREAIYTHFPHDTPASGQHPGTSVRRGDWKLIRLFAGNTDGSDALELYDLALDLSETTNLAQAMPEIAHELNTLITAFLTETKAVIPKLNPSYRPTSPKAAQSTEVAGWSISNDTQLTVERGELIITSTGKDPWLANRKLAINQPGAKTLKLRMTSTAAGPGLVYYSTADKPAFNIASTANFTINHDGSEHEYTIPLPTSPLTALRIDPGNAPGKIIIHSLSVAK